MVAILQDNQQHAFEKHMKGILENELVPVAECPATEDEVSRRQAAENSRERTNQLIAEFSGPDRKTMLKTHSDSEHTLRELFANDREHETIKDIYSGLVAVDQAPAIVPPEEADLPKMLMTKAAWQERNDNPDFSNNAFVSKKVFQQNFDIFTEGLLRNLNWDNVFVAGGAVGACMLPTPPDVRTMQEKRRFYHEKCYKTGDIDLFLYGLTQEEAQLKIKEIYFLICESIPSAGIKVTAIRSKHAITFISQYPYRHVQVILRLYASPAEVLVGFDVDSCSVGYDGQNVWMTPRCLHAYMARYNSIDLTRRSPTYESRLAKYSRRGFAVFVPSFDRSRVDPLIFEHKYESLKGLAKLVVLETLNSAEARMKYKRAKRLRNLRPVYEKKGDLFQKIEGMVANDAFISEAIAEEEISVSDYSAVFLPWGPLWDVKRICEILYVKDCVLNSTEAEEKVFGHRHPCFFGRLEHVMGDACGNCTERPDDAPGDDMFVRGEMTWLTINPGQQTVVGSFHPITEGDWMAGAFIPAEMEPLAEALVSGNKEDLLAVLTSCPDMNMKDTAGRTPLILATLLGNAEAVEELLKRGARIAERMPDGRTSVHIACAEGHLDILKILIQYGTIANERLLAYTESHEENDTLERLLAECEEESPEWYRIMARCTKAEAERKEQMEAELGGLDQLDLDKEDWDSKMTPLMYAVTNQQMDIVRELVSQQVDLSKKLQSFSIITLACSSDDNPELVDFLLDSGFETQEPKTLLSNALKLERTETFKRLVERFPDVNLKECLDSVLKKKDLEMLEYILLKGKVGETHSTVPHLDTALLQSTTSLDFSIFEYLISKGASVNSVNVTDRKSVYDNIVELREKTLKDLSESENTHTEEYFKKKIDAIAEGKKNFDQMLSMLVGNEEMSPFQTFKLTTWKSHYLKSTDKKEEELRQELTKVELKLESKKLIEQAEVKAKNEALLETINKCLAFLEERNALKYDEIEEHCLDIIAATKLREPAVTSNYGRRRNYGYNNSYSTRFGGNSYNNSSSGASLNPLMKAIGLSQNEIDSLKLDDTFYSMCSSNVFPTRLQDNYEELFDSVVSGDIATVERLTDESLGMDRCFVTCYANTNSLSPLQLAVILNLPEMVKTLMTIAKAQYKLIPNPTAEKMKLDKESQVQAANKLYASSTKQMDNFQLANALKNKTSLPGKEPKEKVLDKIPGNRWSSTSPEAYIEYTRVMHGNMLRPRSITAKQSESAMLFGISQKSLDALTALLEECSHPEYLLLGRRLDIPTATMISNMRPYQLAVVYDDSSVLWWVANQLPDKLVQEAKTGIYSGLSIAEKSGDAISNVHLAADHNALKSLTLLLEEEKIDLTHKYKNKTLFDLAREKQYPEVLKILLNYAKERSFEVDKTYLIQVIRDKNICLDKKLQMVTSLLEFGVEVNFVHEGNSPLMWVLDSWKDYSLIDILKKLLEFGADPMLPVENGGLNCLQMSVKKQILIALQLFVDHLSEKVPSKEWLKSDTYGLQQSLQSLACTVGDVEILRYILSLYSSKDDRKRAVCELDGDGMSPFHYAAKRLNQECIDEVLQDISPSFCLQEDLHGKTPMDWSMLETLRLFTSKSQKDPPKISTAVTTIKKKSDGVSRTLLSGKDARQFMMNAASEFSSKK